MISGRTAPLGNPWIVRVRCRSVTSIAFQNIAQLHPESAVLLPAQLNARLPL
jgi:hypothetical protein